MRFKIETTITVIVSKFYIKQIKFLIKTSGKMPRGPIFFWNVIKRKSLISKIQYNFLVPWII